jgi:ribosomal protein L17
MKIIGRYFILILLAMNSISASVIIKNKLKQLKEARQEFAEKIVTKEKETLVPAKKTVCLKEEEKRILGVVFESLCCVLIAQKSGGFASVWESLSTSKMKELDAKSKKNSILVNAKEVLKTTLKEFEKEIDNKLKEFNGNLKGQKVLRPAFIFEDIILCEAAEVEVNKVGNGSYMLQTFSGWW